jgi:hypothetical protein
MTCPCHLNPKMGGYAYVKNQLIQKQKKTCKFIHMGCKVIGSYTKFINNQAFVQ